MAEALLRKRLLDVKEWTIEIKSAGLKKFWRAEMAPHARTVLAEYGIEANHTVKGINAELVEWADLILTMTQFHKFVAIARYPTIQPKTFTLKEFVGSEIGLDIADPVGKSLLVYRECARDLDQTLSQLQSQLLSNQDRLILPLSRPLPQTFPFLRWLVSLVRIP
jgi:protein-tyrosine phosphatase